ncbi:TRPM8 channel-associated factor homolog [Limulus polyphemus]|uniref:TRPM8 channel-associated factor homolog n=1 Tax=Limulus polyphemus TaxID=6850 RepID=A0ABM1BGP1_LIMPO|nr:TRPM8 channel-associated factor homolog [Limulus polyphemus]
MAKWREELLQGITSVEGKGNSGKMVVWGEKAEPILAGNYADQVFMVAAEHGNGRMVVFSQNPYGEAFLQNPDWFSQLRQNIIKWLSKGADLQNVNIVRVRGGTKFDELKVGETIAVLKGSSKPENKEFFQNLEDFVTSGGAVVIAETPWGYLQLIGGSIETMPHFKLLRNVGVCFTTKYFSNTGEVKVEDNPAYYAHLGRRMKKAQESQENLQQLANSIVKMISIMPKSLLVSEDSFKTFFETCEEYIKQTIIPTSQKPVKEQSAKDLLILYDILLRLNGRKAPGIEHFPGDFESPPVLTKATISLNSTLRDFHPTGYYLPAGQEMKMTVKGTDVQGWKIRIGCHSDNLKHVTKGWKRWPSIMVGRPVSPGETTISSPYGGLIYFESPPAKKSLEVELESVVEAPYFDIKDPEAPSHWKNRKHSPGLWTDLVGEFLIITLPSSSIRNFDHPTEPLTFWDQVIRSLSLSSWNGHHSSPSSMASSR